MRGYRLGLRLDASNLGSQIEKSQQGLPDRIENDPAEKGDCDRTEIAHCAGRIQRSIQNFDKFRRSGRIKAEADYLHAAHKPTFEQFRVRDAKPVCLVD
jgi:hypothetical protein